MPALTREQILKADDIRPFLTEIEVPEWGGSAFIRVLTGGERGRIEELVKKVGEDKARAIVAAIAIGDEEGNPLFTEADIQALNERSAKALERVMKEVDNLNLVSKQAREAEGKKGQPDA